jgi:hypothetical protein
MPNLNIQQQERQDVILHGIPTHIAGKRIDETFLKTLAAAAEYGAENNQGMVDALKDWGIEDIPRRDLLESLSLLNIPVLKDSEESAIDEISFSE